MGPNGPGKTTLLHLAMGAGWAYYQPDVLFWPFQSIESAIFLALAALLVGLAYYWTTRLVT